MSRNLIIPAIVLRARKIGEYDKSLSVVTPGAGIMQVTVYGAYRSRSRLSGTSEPFNALRLYLYHEPVKNRYKVTDAEIIRCFEHIRTDLDRYYTAILWAEVLLASYAGGDDSSRAYRLLLGALARMDEVPGDDIPYLSVQFLWRYIRLSGFLPDLADCSICGASLSSEIAFRAAESLFVCKNCTVAGDLQIPDGVFMYLKRSLEVNWDMSMRMKVDNAMTGMLKRIVLSVIAEMVEIPLKTLAAGVMKL